MRKQPRKTAGPGHAEGQAHAAKKRREFLSRIDKKRPPRKKPAGKK